MNLITVTCGARNAYVSLVKIFFSSRTANATAARPLCTCELVCTTGTLCDDSADASECRDFFGVHHRESTDLALLTEARRRRVTFLAARLAPPLLASGVVAFWH